MGPEKILGEGWRGHKNIFPEGQTPPSREIFPAGVRPGTTTKRNNLGMINGEGSGGGHRKILMRGLPPLANYFY